MNAISAYVLAKKFTSDSLAGMGALKGSPCQIENIVDDGNGNQVVNFVWYDNNGVKHTDSASIAKGQNGQADTIIYKDAQGKDVSVQTALNDLYKQTEENNVSLQDDIDFSAEW